MTLEEFKQKLTEILSANDDYYNYVSFFTEHATGNTLELEFDAPLLTMEDVKEICNARLKNDRWENYSFMKYEVKKIK